MTADRRGQANLLALGVALVLVATAAGVAVTAASGAFATTERDPIERQVAVGLADRLVATDGPLGDSRNVLDDRAIGALDAETLRSIAPALRDSSIRARVTVGNRSVTANGDPIDGSTVRRYVLVERRRPAHRSLPVRGRPVSTELSERVDEVTVDLSTTPATVTAVRLNGRTVRRNESGLSGILRLSPDRTRPPAIALVGEVPDDLPGASVNATIHPWSSRTANVTVTVDA